MFGPYYLRRDEALADASVSPAARKEEYASYLLEELLNRAAVLEGPLGNYEYIVNIDPRGAARCLAMAVEVFLSDVMEARIRARRARFVAGSGVFHEPVTAENAEPAESLEKIGGALVAKEA